MPHTLYMGHVTDLATSKTKSPQNTSKTHLKSFLDHKKQKKNFRFFSPHTLYMDPHLSSTPTPEPQCHMPPYYRRHNSYLIAIRCKKNNLDIMCLRGKSAAHKTCSFSPIPYTWGLNRRPRRWAPQPNHLTKWPQTRWCTTRDLALSNAKNPSQNGHSFRYDVLRTKKSVTNTRTDGRTPLFDPPPNATIWTGWSMKTLRD